MKCVDELFLKIPDETDKLAVLEFRDELLEFGGELNGEGGIARENISYEEWLERYNSLEPKIKNELEQIINYKIF